LPVSNALDPHDRRADPVDDRDHGAGVGVEQDAVVERVVEGGWGV
jgi:hypothetical protein